MAFSARHRRCLAGSLMALGAAALLTPAPALSQRRFTITMAAMPLDKALLALARQSGRNILFDPASVAGMVARPVQAMDFDTALRQMLDGLPVRVVRQSAGISIARSAVRPVRRARSAAVRTAAAPKPQPAEPATVYVIGTRPVQAPAPGLPDPGTPDADLLTSERTTPVDRNLAEALARMPGVLTLATNLQGDLGGIDRAARADGQFTAIRGLSGAYSLVTIDGVVMPQALPYGRDAQMGLLPAFDFGAVRLIKTPGSERAGDATGAVIDVQTPSAFDPGAEGLRLVATGGADSSAISYHQRAGYGQFGLRFARRFGDDRWGISLGVQASRRAFANSQQTYQEGSIELRVVDARGRTPAGIDPASNLLLTSVNAQFTRGETRSASAMAALDFQPSSDLHVYARVSAAATATDQDIYQLGFQGGSGTADITRTANGDGTYSLASTRGSLHYWYQTNPERTHFALAQIGAVARPGAIELRARTHFGLGVVSRPDHIETSFWDSDATALPTGVQLTTRDGYPVPQLSAADATLASSVLDYPVHRQGQKRDQRSDDHRLGGDLALARRFDGGAIEQIELGASFDRSQRSNRLVDMDYSGLLATGTTLGESGLVSGSIAAILPGIYDFRLPLIDGDVLRERIRAATAPDLSADTLNGSSLDVTETVAAAYARMVVVRGAATLTVGLRGEDARLHSRYWVSGNDGVDADGVDYGWNRSRSSFTALLPNLALRWRNGPGAMFRGAVWTSYTRPSAAQLAGSATVETTATGTLRVTRGNPDLRAVRALNLDLGQEWRGGDGALLSVAVFAKRLANYLYDAGGDYANTQESGGDAGITVIEPRNGGTAHLLGLETSAVLPLARLTGELAAWTVAVQATLLHGRVRLHNADLDDVEHMQYAPDYNVSAELRYRHGGWSASLLGRWTGAYVQQYGLLGTSASGYSVLASSAFDTWVRPARQIDASIARAVGMRATIRLFGRNLLADLAYRSTVGRYSDTVPQTVSTGRLIGLRMDLKL
ncbi:TonB-dependent receptor [Novosphingobium sp. Rr 2-17]|uniref:TonB-dependent receptor n=1 Tax=Novosphingobium sp. Rr 2-17 TaxID=555793 RepID=UPI0002698193|nr:TonB-dependent receptor [Novosphingobium sp. Rr 2-17]EIZ80481.1 TonB-dependent receptor [Novosphingobium sp. Rr 2-17]